MLSRIFWVGLAGLALVIGMVLQDGGPIFSFADGHSDISARTERTIEASVDRAIDGSFDRMQVTDGDGNEIDVPAETRRALGEAVGRLVKAEADLAVLKIRDGSAEEMRAASARRDQARADVDRLKAEIKGEGPAAKAEHDALAAQIERQVRDDVREDVRAEIRDDIRDAVRN